MVWAFPPPHKELIMKFLNCIAATPNMEAVVILPMAQSMAVVKAVSMATDLPVLKQCSGTLLTEPTSYSVHADKEEFQD